MIKYILITTLSISIWIHGHIYRCFCYEYKINSSYLLIFIICTFKCFLAYNYNGEITDITLKYAFSKHTLLIFNFVYHVYWSAILAY